jgi:hypothetical protein
MPVSPAWSLVLLIDLKTLLMSQSPVPLAALYLLAVALPFWVRV